MNELSPNHRGSRGNIWLNLKEHKVLQWSQTYLAASLALVHGEDLIGHAFHWNEIIGQWLIGVLAVGFLPAIAISWYQGHKGMTRVSGGEMMIASLLLLIGAGLFTAFTHASTEDVEEGAVVNTGTKRLAVLPFENQSPDPANAFFADGLSQEILATLAQRAPELEVISSAAIAPFAHHPNPGKEIFRELGATHILAGTVRREGQAVRVTLELSNARTHVDIWTNTYDRTLQSAFTVESEVANAVAARLAVEFSGKRAGIQPPEGDPVAYDSYLIHKLEQPQPNTPTTTALSKSNDLDSSVAVRPGPSAKVIENVAELPCASEFGLASTYGPQSMRVAVTTHNETASNIQLFWIDYSKARQLYAVVRPTEAVSIDTWSTHPWVVTDTSGKCILAYLPSDQKGQVTVR